MGGMVEMRCVLVGCGTVYGGGGGVVWWVRFLLSVCLV